MGGQPGMGMGGGGMSGPGFPSMTRGAPGSAYGAMPGATQPSMMAQQDFPAASTDTSLPQDYLLRQAKEA